MVVRLSAPNMTPSLKFMAMLSRTLDRGSVGMGTKARG